MKIVKTLNIPAEFFYQQVINSVIFDIRKNTGETLKTHQLNGYSYIKQFSKNSKGRITIDELVKNEVYRFTTTTSRNEFKVSYQIKSVGSNACEVTYTEEMTSYGFLQKANDLLFSAFLIPLKKKQLIQMLTSIETSY